MAQFPRGISPELLLSQVKNTMPYLFTEDADSPWKRFVPTRILKDYARSEGKTLSHLEYFRLCVSCHYLTVATPVPTDVDIQIRRKLWPAQLPLDVALQMADFVLESRRWDFTLVSNRCSKGAGGGTWRNEVICGHHGEWFTVAAGAYCALKQYSDPLAEKKGHAIYNEIADEVHRHSEIFASLWKAKDGLESLKASAVIAHNFGDLDRVMDMWDLSVADPLRLNFNQLTRTPFDSEKKLRYLGRIWVAGQLYKSIIHGSSMAFENHRHFALRKPKCLRRSRALLITTGPFLDDWGKAVARYFASRAGASSEAPSEARSEAPTEETQEVVEALVHGWNRLPKTVGYGRALRGMLEVHPELDLGELTKQQRAVLGIPQGRFEDQWNEKALQELEDIPSRA